MLKAILISLVVGAFAVSFAEYHFKYNLIDLLKDKIVAVLHKLL